MSLRARRLREVHWYSLSGRELAALADYNAERARGLVHTAEYANRMADLQRIFDADRERHVAEQGGVWV